LRLLKYSFLIKNSFWTYSVPLFHKNDRNTHTLPPSLPKSFPFSSVRLHEIIKNNLNETPTRQFQKKTGKERNLLSASISLHPKPLSIALRSAPLNLDRFHGDLEKALSVSPGNTKGILNPNQSNRRSMVQWYFPL
jgi:hypothetical protein